VRVLLRWDGRRTRLRTGASGTGHNGLMSGSESGLARRTLVLIVAEVVALTALGIALSYALRGGSAASPQAGGQTPTISSTPSPSSRPTSVPTPTHTPSGTLPKTPTIPASDFKKFTWGYVGCSNTHDTVYGYHATSGTANLFWPWADYKIEGQTVPLWADPNSADWGLFDQEKTRYNGGASPPVVWIQMCVDLAPRTGDYGVATYDDVVQVIKNAKAHAPGAFIFVSPLQSYDPPTLCYLMGPGAPEIPQMQQWLAQAVGAGLAYPGPGVDGIANLGPLTRANAFTDGCHPTGDPIHGPGTGAEFLGGQLADFFDKLPRT
jgi:hypothetical protein